ncbi:hypothetical protein [Muricoccus radiodurans]|uniref:hypothetical protein n=1 Tax=Muricoccus radiodurans TaxID=2231721 RepID=UPI003CF13426
MRICVVIPSDAYLSQAGARIRYGRLRASLTEEGAVLETETIDRIRPEQLLSHDVFLISKCHDARAVVAARMASATGRCVGVDLFDDYFSQSRDSRFVHLRRWLRSLAGSLDFAICSTPRMREVVESVIPGLPCHVMNDPRGALDLPAIGRRCAAKAARVAATRSIRLGWFGIGDNPHFEVGLTDLVAYADALRAMRNAGYDVRLSILTNVRALTVTALEALRRLPVPHRVEEWNEALEAEQIAESDACFIPVNGQPFSAAKSLNRGVSVLVGGAQLLSRGYPLYDALGALVYRDPLILLRDLEAGVPALRPETLPDLARILGTWADPRQEAASLLRFLRDVTGRPTSAGAEEDAAAVVMLHGQRSTAGAHKIAQRFKQLSIATPFSSPGLNYDAAFALAPGTERLDLHLTERAWRRMAPGEAARAVPLDSPEGGLTRTIAGACADAPLSHRIAVVQRSRSYPVAAALAPSVMADLQDLSARLWPGAEILVSELDPALVGTGPADRSALAPMEERAHAA